MLKLYNTPCLHRRHRNRRIRSCLRTTRWIITSWIKRPSNCWTPPAVTAILHLICNSHWPLNRRFKLEEKSEPKGPRHLIYFTTWTWLIVYVMQETKAGWKWISVLIHGSCVMHLLQYTEGRLHFFCHWRHSSYGLDSHAAPFRSSTTLW